MHGDRVSWLSRSIYGDSVNDTGISDSSADRLLHASTEEAGEDRLLAALREMANYRSNMHLLLKYARLKTLKM